MAGIFVSFEVLHQGEALGVWKEHSESGLNTCLNTEARQGKKETVVPDLFINSGEIAHSVMLFQLTFSKRGEGEKH